MCFIIFVTLVLFFSGGKSLKANDFTAFLAVGPLYTTPGSVRVGMNDWEAGLLTSNIMGFNKNFRKDYYYFSFGFATTTYQYSIGPYGAAGIDYIFFKWFGVRCEVNAIMNISGVTKGSALVGVSINF